MAKAKKISKLSTSPKRFKKNLKKATREKLIGKVDHIFEKIQVITTTLKAPLKLGDVVRIKGHTTDFVQSIDSMQIEHQNVQKAKKGDGVGIKVKDYVRDNDLIYLADKKTALEFRKKIAPIVSVAVMPPKQPTYQRVLPVQPRPAPSSQPRFLSF